MRVVFGQRETAIHTKLNQIGHQNEHQGGDLWIMPGAVPMRRMIRSASARRGAEKPYETNEEKYACLF
jgi:hypothetical protein